MDFGSAPSVPEQPPPEPQPKLDTPQLEKDQQTANLFARRRRGQGTLLVNPTATSQNSQTGLYLGGR